jgi:hypothetical protein
MNKEVNEKFLEICEVFEKPTEKKDANNGFFLETNGVQKKKFYHFLMEF